MAYEIRNVRFTTKRTANLPCPKRSRHLSPNGLKSLQDRRTRKRIQSQIDRIESGNLGKPKPVGDGVFELRFQFGPGYRVYFGQVGNTIVLLLCGGDKSSQDRDIEQAKAYWQEYKESQK